MEVKVMMESTQAGGAMRRMCACACVGGWLEQDLC